eukprot:TRINITY_DN8149_c3_g1_i2.p1 TRINITY_DN8149_c3_g1~~TRINITY_DN8149_c3_g1_i2.p1  ORF type:complete len:2243 (+),score=670.98 TRINITY_DN8149_c3_g1_i2:128-6730(+)
MASMATRSRGSSDRLLSFLRERFRGEAEAASFLGGPSGREAMLNADEFSRALRMAGFREPSDQLFLEFCQDDEYVRVADLLQSSGLSREAPERDSSSAANAPAAVAASRAQPQQRALGEASLRPLASPLGTSTLSAMQRPALGLRDFQSFRNDAADVASPVSEHAAAPATVDRQLRAEVEELRREVAHLRVKSDAAASHDDLMQERGGRQITETAMRQLSAKLEEGLSRETVALRADCSDLRASLTEALGLLAEEKKAHHEQNVENERRMRELQHWADERIARLESVSRAAEHSGGENKTSLKSIEQILHATEFRILGLLSEETRAREAALATERQVREASEAELEGRWRSLLNEERGVRGKEHDLISEKFATIHDKMRAEKEMQNERANDTHAKFDATMRDLKDEERQRQAEIANLHSHLDDVRGRISGESRERKDVHDEHGKRHENLKSSHEQHMAKVEKEVAMLKQTCLDLRAALQLENTTREEAVAKLHGFVSSEARNREDAVEREAAGRLSQEKAFEQHFGALLMEERSNREDALGKLDAKISALQHEYGFEKAKASAQARELSSALAHTREALQTESVARKNELAAATKNIFDLRDGFDQEKALRDKAEQRWLEHVSDLHATIRDESAARETTERKVLNGHAELTDSHANHARSLEELETMLLSRLDEERRLREESLQKEKSAREDADCENFRHLQEAISSESSQREQAHKALEQGHKGHEQARSVDQLEREERDKNFSARLGELSEELADARQRLREATARCDRLNELKDLFQQEKSARQSQETSLEMAVKELQVRMDQQVQQHEHHIRKQEQGHENLHDKVEAEIKNRNIQIGDLAKRLSVEKVERDEKHQEERRHLQGLLDDHKGEIHGHLSDHKNTHHEALGELRAKTLEISANVDEARLHRNEHYNDLVQEVSKLAEMLAEEAKARMHQDQALAAEFSRLRENAAEEVVNRRKAVDGFQGELRGALQRIEQLREHLQTKERERSEAHDKVQADHGVHKSKTESGLHELRQLIDREVLRRDELLAGATRAWQKANQHLSEEMQAKLCSETTALEGVASRLQQDMQDLRGEFKTEKATADHTATDLQNRLKATNDAILAEEKARKAEEILLHKSLEDVRRAIASEHSERASGEQHTSDRFLVLEGHFRDEAAAREDGDRRSAKDILDLQNRLQSEAALREEHDHKLDRQLATMSSAHEERVQGESKSRELGHATVLDTLAKSLAEEQASRTKDRKELSGMIQDLQHAQQLEHEDRVKVMREFSTNLTRLQSLEKEEEESRVEQGERLTAAVENLQEGVRGLTQQREELMKRFLDGVDQVKAGLHQESQARLAKDQQLDEGVRDLAKRLQDEARERTVAVNAVNDAVSQERAHREEAVLRERKLAEEDVHRALQTSRKAREDEERKLQERILEVTTSISRERDMRQEALRQEHQQTLQLKEELVRDLRALKAEVAAQGLHVEKTKQEHAKRTKDIEDLTGSHAERMDGHRAELHGLHERHEAAIQGLEERSLELSKGFEKLSREPSNIAADLRRHVDEELAAMKATIVAEQRLRESTDQQTTAALRSGLRSEAEARESGCAALASEIASVKSQLENESGRHDDKHGDHQANFQKIHSDLAEVQSSRKVDLAAMHDALGHVAAEMKAVAQQRKDDLEGLQAHIAHMGSNSEEHAKNVRESVGSTEQTLQVLQAELQREVEARISLGTKLEARLKEEHRIVEGFLSTEKLQREAGLRLIQEAHDHDVHEEAKKTKAIQDRLTASLLELADDLKKERDTNAERVRELSRCIASLQTGQTNEERARRQTMDHLQQSVDSLREELGAHGKKWNNEHQGQMEELQRLQRLKGLHDEKIDALQKRLGSETADLRDAIARESKRFGAAAAPEPRSASNSTTPEREASSIAAPAFLTPGYPGGAAAELRDLKRKTEEDLQRQRRQVETIAAEQQALSKTVGNVSERVDATRSGLVDLQGAISDVYNTQKAAASVGMQLDVLRTDLQKEVTDRKAEQEKLLRGQGDLEHRLDRGEQQRLTGEDRARQEILQTQAAMKKELREHSVAVDNLQVVVREEKEAREEAVSREGRLRQDGQEQLKTFFQDAMREERRVREKELLRLEGRVPSSVTGLGKPGFESLSLGGAGDGGVNASAEIRGMRQALGDTQNRLNQVEQRQKSAEERTVSMLDAIMSGLTHPAEGA